MPLQRVTRYCPYIEYPDPELVTSQLLRVSLAGPEPVLRDVYLELPSRPGLGVELNEEIVERCRTSRRQCGQGANQ